MNILKFKVNICFKCTSLFSNNYYSNCTNIELFALKTAPNDIFKSTHIRILNESENIEN